MARRDSDHDSDDAELALDASSDSLDSDPDDELASERASPEDPDEDPEADDEDLDGEPADATTSDDEANDDLTYEAEAPDADEPSRRPPPGRRSLGPTLITLGAGVWAIAAALRCGAPEPGPSLSVSPDAATPSAEAPEGEPDPADADEPPPGEFPEGEISEGEPEPASADRPELGPDEADEPPLAASPEDWATDLTVPRKVAYTIRRGGSIKNVANLFKIFHHEITALNPGVTLEQELPPNSKVVVYVEDQGAASESVDYPSAGSLEGAVPMVEGPGRVLKMIPWKSWGTAHTVALLDQVLRQWAKRGSSVQPVLVGNMSSRKGGRLEPHSTHQSGRDVDISYIQKLPEGEELNWREMNADNLDAAETWALLKLLRSTGQVEVIFIDSSIQKLLYDHAKANGTVPESELSRWLQYPKGSRNALVQHVKGHVDHIHVRFECQPHETRCKSKPP